jgi:hypothetical protein
LCNQLIYGLGGDFPYIIVRIFQLGSQAVLPVTMFCLGLFTFVLVFFLSAYFSATYDPICKPVSSFLRCVFVICMCGKGQKKKGYEHHHHYGETHHHPHIHRLHRCGASDLFMYLLII